MPAILRKANGKQASKINIEIAKHTPRAMAGRLLSAIMISVVGHDG
jgi:hypothetical protein